MKRRVASVDSAKPLNESESGTHTEEQEFSKYSGIFQSTPANQPSLPRKTRQTASMTTAPDSREGTTKDFIMGNLAKPSKRESLVSTCVGCSKHITDPYILKVYPDLEWHAACLRCVECNQNLDESCTCFFREGKIYCKTDYCRKFSVRCAQCQAGLLSSDLVLRARGLTYHQQCFCCVACNRQLLPGDVFRLRLDGPYCIKDGGLPDTGSYQEGPLSSLADTGALYLSEKFKAYQARHAAKHPDKITRVRTVLNEQQLLTLRTCYAANPRPDALMKQQLIEMTGLSSRVIRVWFQNKRCKDKKKSVLQKHPDQCNRDKMQSLPARRIKASGIWERRYLQVYLQVMHHPDLEKYHRLLVKILELPIRQLSPEGLSRFTALSQGQLATSNKCGPFQRHKSGLERN